MTPCPYPLTPGKLRPFGAAHSPAGYVGRRARTGSHVQTPETIEKMWSPAGWRRALQVAAALQARRDDEIDRVVRFLCDHGALPSPLVTGAFKPCCTSLNG